MGLWAKAAAGVLGVLLIGGPLWPAALICFAYLALALRPKRPRLGVGADRPGGRVRQTLAVLLFALSAVAFVSGGTFSPVVFFLGGAVALFWPRIPWSLPAGEVVPVEGSILFRSKYLPFVWHALGELKPGSGAFPRALASFSGTLILFTDTGRAHALATCFALDRSAAEADLSSQLRDAALRTRASAFPLPLDSGAACEILSREFTRVKLQSGDLTRAVTNLSGVLVLKCGGGSVREAGAYEVGGRVPSRPKVPGRGRLLADPPLLWEVLEGVGKRTRWPDPDSYSSLLDSLNATRGVPLGDRLKEIEGTGGEVSLQTLGGVEVRVTRPQLRALVSMYS